MPIVAVAWSRGAPGGREGPWEWPPSPARHAACCHDRCDGRRHRLESRMSFRVVQGLTPARIRVAWSCKEAVHSLTSPTRLMKNPPSTPDLEAIFRSAPNLVLVLAPDFTIVAVNDAVLRATKVGREDILGRPLFEVFPDDRRDSTDGGEANLRASLARVLATHVPDQMAAQRYDVRRPGGDGGVLEIRYWNWLNYPVLGPEGRVVYIVHQSEEVTELVQLRRRSAHHASQLAQAESLYRAIYDQGIFAGRLDLDGTVTDANRSCLEQCGFERQDVIGKRFWECGWWNRSPEIQARVKAAFAQAAGGEPFHGVSTYFWADGTERVVDLACLPIKNEAGEVAFVVPTGIDITDRSRAEQENLATSILESITDGFFALDRDWRFTYVNGQAERILGRDRSGLIGKILWDEYPGLAGSMFEGAYRRAADEGIPSSVTSYYPDHDRWYEVHATPANDGISLYFRDVSERIQAEAVIRESEERHRLIMANVNDHAIFTLGLDGRITEWNAGAERVFGHNREIIGQAADILFTPEDREAGRVERELELCLANGRASDERWHIKKDGTRFFASGSMESLRGEDGVLRGFVKVVRDQTEKMKAEQQRQELTARIALQARLFDTALSNSPDFIYTFDLRGRFTYLNRALLALLERSPDEALGRDFFDLDFPPELAARLLRQIREVIEGKTQVQDETPFTSAWGLASTSTSSSRSSPRTGPWRPSRARRGTSRGGSRPRRPRGGGPSSSRSSPRSRPASTRRRTSSPSSAS